MNYDKDIKIIHHPIICDQCDGDGTVEVGPMCNKPASDCCGGCFETEQCDLCEGSGAIVINQDDEEMQELDLIFQAVSSRIKILVSVSQDLNEIIKSQLDSNSCGNQFQLLQFKNVNNQIKLNKQLLQRTYDNIVENNKYLKSI